MCTIGILPCPNTKCWAENNRSVLPLRIIGEQSPNNESYRVQCQCGSIGPHGETEAAAIAAWDALPRMSALVAWQFQAAGAALENHRLKAILQGILDNDGGEKGFNAFELDKFRQQARAAVENRHE